MLRALGFEPADCRACQDLRPFRNTTLGVSTMSDATQYVYRFGPTGSRYLHYVYGY